MATNFSLNQNRARVAGAGFTIFTFAGQPISFCEQVSHTSPKGVAQPVPIQPMDEPYPVEILVAPAAGPGQLVLNLFELFGQKNGAASKVWDRLGLGASGSGGGPFGIASNVENLGFVNFSQGPGSFDGNVDIVDIFLTQAQLDPSKMGISKYIRPLPVAGNTYQPYSDEYHGCVITDVVDGENVAVAQVEIIKQITVAYRFVTRNGNPSRAFAVRDRNLNT